MRSCMVLKVVFPNNSKSMCVFNRGHLSFCMGSKNIISLAISPRYDYKVTVPLLQQNTDKMESYCFSGCIDDFFT